MACSLIGVSAGCSQSSRVWATSGRPQSARSKPRVSTAATRHANCRTRRSSTRVSTRVRTSAMHRHRSRSTDAHEQSICADNAHSLTGQRVHQIDGDACAASSSCTTSRAPNQCAQFDWLGAMALCRYGRWSEIDDSAASRVFMGTQPSRPSRARGTKASRSSGLRRRPRLRHRRALAARWCRRRSARPLCLMWPTGVGPAPTPCRAMRSRTRTRVTRGPDRQRPRVHRQPVAAEADQGSGGPPSPPSCARDSSSLAISSAAARD